MKFTLTTFSLISQLVLFGQNYSSFFIGNSIDVITEPESGICLMGGATEDDNAMIWFLNRADGGDVLVLRSSGSDGYNDYFYTDLGVSVNSVETIVFNNASASYDPYIAQKIQQAEAIWIAGGDQWDYISYWRNTPVDSLINVGITQRNIVIGGTSAGMAIQGSHYFSAQNGTVSSATALANPYSQNVTVSATPFLSNEHLQDVITDSHYDNPDRTGRHLVFLARIITDSGVIARGIACDEYTSVCIEPTGIARIYGGFPTYDDNAYFLQPNCELTDAEPENCTPFTPLHWNYAGKAVKVYHVMGTSSGANTFDLTTWETGSGGMWEDWSVQNGTVNITAGNAPNCSTSGVTNLKKDPIISIFPNPAHDQITLLSPFAIITSTILSLDGKVIQQTNEQFSISVSTIPSGNYLLRIELANGHIEILPLGKI